MTAIDEGLQQWIVGHRVDALDWLVVAFSYAGSFGLLWIAIAAALALVRGRRTVLLATAAAVVAADLLAIVLKGLVDRPRPYRAFPEQDPLLTSTLEGAMPSGHAATSFAGAVVLSRAAPRLLPVLLVLAAAMAWSRVYVGVHYPSDVLAGALLGAGVGGLVAYGAARAPRSPAAGPRRSPPRQPPG